MIDRFIRYVRLGILYVREHPQFLLSLLLIFVVPIGFLISGQQFLNAAKGNQETLDRERISLFHDVFISYLKAVSFDPIKMQHEIEILAGQNTDITQFIVAKDTPEGVVIIASLAPADVNTMVENPQGFRASLYHELGSLMSLTANNNVRYWQSYRYVRSLSGEQYYIFTETSLERIDSIIAFRARMAYLILAGILTVVMFLLVRHVRLIDYSYLYKQVKRANEVKDLFTNMIAHELRAPLTAMRGYASLIREHTGVAPEIKEQAERIEDSAERLVVIVNDLLDVARIQSGKLSVQFEDVDVFAVISTVADSLRPMATEKNIDLVMGGAKSAVMVRGDSKRLTQALTNLVSNAIKYTPKGMIEISVEDRKDRIELRVKDTGMGIRAEDQKELFAPFFRVQSDDVSAITGTGLGMWITKQLIELMHGSIGVESIRGVGTHVVVTLPKQ